MATQRFTASSPSASPGFAPKRAGARRPARPSPLQELWEAARREDWQRDCSLGLTHHIDSEWASVVERCSVLRGLVANSGARRTLEVGSFCGLGALAMAEALPEDGEVHALERDRFAVDFGRRFWARSLDGRKIRHKVGPVFESLRLLAAEARAGRLQPFSLAVVRADKENTRKYFDLLWESRGMLSADAIVCVDMTPLKGSPPVHYEMHGVSRRWAINSEQEELNSLRQDVMGSPAFVAYELGGLLIVQRRALPSAHRHAEAGDQC